MRDFKISETKTIEIKALTRMQVKELRAQGINLMALTMSQAEDSMDVVFAMAMTQDSIEELNGQPYHVALSAWKAILTETYGSKEEVKN